MHAIAVAVFVSAMLFGSIMCAWIALRKDEDGNDHD
jgi:hypothetical protein